jgi:hypothetical protein
MKSTTSAVSTKTTFAFWHSSKLLSVRYGRRKTCRRLFGRDSGRALAIRCRNEGRGCTWPGRKLKDRMQMVSDSACTVRCALGTSSESAVLLCSRGIARNALEALQGRPWQSPVTEQKSESRHCRRSSCCSTARDRTGNAQRGGAFHRRIVDRGHPAKHHCSFLHLASKSLEYSALTTS